MKSDDKFIKRAVELAIEHSESGINGPFGAIIVKDGNVVGEGWNHVVSGNDPTAHAEISAIRDACNNLNTHLLIGCTLYSSCEPCPMCMSAIYWARIERVVYSATGAIAAKSGFDDLWIMDELKKEPSNRKIIIENLDADLGKVAFEKWDNNSKKVMY